MAAFEVAQLEDIYEVESFGAPMRAVRHHFGISTFGINAMVARTAGEQLIKEHSESGPGASEELYVVTSGAASFELDGAPVDAPEGAFVYVPAGTRRSAVAKDAGTVVLAISGAPAGEIYEVNGWELFAPLLPLFESRDYELGAERARELIAEHPTYGALFYNTACFEARAGQTDEALAHLRRAVELSPRLADLAREDEDLAALHDKTEFAGIVG